MNSIQDWWYHFLYAPVIGLWQDFRHKNDPPAACALPDMPGSCTQYPLLSSRENVVFRLRYRSLKGNWLGQVVEDLAAPIAINSLCRTGE
jgi:hypothetical protein